MTFLSLFLTHFVEYLICKRSFTTLPSYCDALHGILFGVIVLRHFGLQLGGLTKCYVIHINDALRLSSVVINSCANPTFLLVLPHSSLLRLLLFMAFTLFFTFLHSSLFVVTLASFSLSWRFMDSMKTTRLRAVTWAAVTSHVIISNGGILPFWVTSDNTMVDLMAEDSRRCALRVTCAKICDVCSSRPQGTAMGPRTKTWWHWGGRREIDLFCYYPKRRVHTSTVLKNSATSRSVLGLSKKTLAK